MRELPAGHDAVLLDFTAEPDPAGAVGRAAGALMRAAGTDALPTVADVIPAATTILVQARPGSGIDILGIHRCLRSDSAVDGAGKAGDAAIREPGDRPEAWL